MKVRITLKDPDRMQDCVDSAFSKLDAPDGVSVQEWRRIRDDRADAVKDEIADRFMEYGEYLTFEVDTDTWAATIVPRRA